MASSLKPSAVAPARASFQPNRPWPPPLTAPCSEAAPTAAAARSAPAAPAGSGGIGHGVGAEAGPAHGRGPEAGRAVYAAPGPIRTGEREKGFSAVADAVRGLAERSGRAAKGVETLVEHIRAETDAVVAAMETGITDVERGGGLAEQSGRALDGILEVVGERLIRLRRTEITAALYMSSIRRVCSSPKGRVHQLHRESSLGHKQHVVGALRCAAPLHLAGDDAPHRTAASASSPRRSSRSIRSASQTRATARR